MSWQRRFDGVEALHGGEISYWDDSPFRSIKFYFILFFLYIFSFPSDLQLVRNEIGDWEDSPCLIKIFFSPNLWAVCSKIDKWFISDFPFRLNSKNQNILHWNKCSLICNITKVYWSLYPPLVLFIIFVLESRIWIQWNSVIELWEVKTRIDFLFS